MRDEHHYIYLEDPRKILGFIIIIMHHNKCAVLNSLHRAFKYIISFFPLEHDVSRHLYSALRLQSTLKYFWYSQNHVGDSIVQ